MIKIRRGTTPTIRVTVPDAITPESIKTVWLSISQLGRLVIDKTTEDFEAEGQVLRVRLEQADTLALSARVQTFAQVRLLTADGTAVATDEDEVVVAGLVKDGVIA